MSSKGKTATKSSKPRATRSTAKPNAGAEGGENKVKGIYYIVYVDTYVSDGEILARGVYKTNKAIARLDQSKGRYVKKFEGSIPDKTVHEIAEQLKVSLTDADGNYRKSSELLSEITTEL